MRTSVSQIVWLSTGFGELTDITDIRPPSSHENSMPKSVRNPKELLDDPRQCYAD
jgi:hypothetical protein